MLRPDMYTIQEDRKYAELEAKFRAAEQQRIIELLADYQHPNTAHEFNDEFCDSLIALIKG